MNEVIKLAYRDITRSSKKHDVPSNVPFSFFPFLNWSVDKLSEQEHLLKQALYVLRSKNAGLSCVRSSSSAAGAIQSVCRPSLSVNGGISKENL